MTIISNKIRCRNCGIIIESLHRHDFKWCPCGACAVDGGVAYLKRSGNPMEYEELSDFENEDPGQDG